MKKIPANIVLFSAVVLILFIVFSSGVLAANNYDNHTDGTDETIKRIVSLSNDPATIVVLLGKGDLLVGVSDTFLENEMAKELCPNAVSIGSDPPDLEKIISLQPDIVLSYNYKKSSPEVSKLIDAGVKVVFLDGYIVDKIPEEVSYLGKILGAEKEAMEYNQLYNNITNLINSKVGQEKIESKTRVYFESSSQFSTVGKGSGGNSLIELAHGENIAGNLDITWPVVSGEWLLSQNPDVFIKIGYASKLVNSSMKEMRDEIFNDPQYNQLSAVKNNRTYILNHKIAYNPLGIISVLYLAKAFYPEEFSDIDPDNYLKYYSDSFVPVPVETINESFYPKFWKMN